MKKVPLKDYFERVVTDMDRRLQQRFESQENALREQKTSTEKRLEGMNEFRAALSDQAGKYITKSEALALVLAGCAITGSIIGIINFFMHR